MNARKLVQHCKTHFEMCLSIAGDLKQAFLLIRINEDDQDAVRFHCIQDRKMLETVVLRFTRLMFGLSPSPFVPKDTIKHHLERCEKDQPET